MKSASPVDLSGYTLTAVVHRGRYWVDRAVRQGTEKAVILKRVDPGISDPPAASRLRWEHTVLSRLLRGGEVRGLPRNVALHDGLSPILCMDDIAAVSLLEGGKRHPGEALRIVTQVCAVLGHLHQNGVFHKDVNPSNIIYNAVSGEVELIDFGLASDDEADSTGQHHFAGTLAYMAPEHTGRMRRRPDHRADLYALGATLYELLAGRPPFVETDEVSLTHAILTRNPTPLLDLAAHVSPQVAEIVHKLLTKSADERYQSAYGLLRDLQECTRQMDDSGTVSGFPLARHDRNERFTLPDRLYGRDEELTQLRGAYVDASSGKRRIVLLGGMSGAGKSALVDALGREVVEGGALLAAGKFDVLKRQVPFHAFAQAMSMLLRHILSREEAQVETWRRRLQGAVGNIGQAIVNIAPVLERLLGPQRPLSQLPPRESLNRLLWTLQSFVREVSAQTPFVLFLDDVQWADAGVAKFLRELLVDTQVTAGLLVIIAFREEDVLSRPLVAAILENVAEDRVTRIDLAPLDERAVEAMVRTVVGRDATDLAHLVYQKTGGNAFFARQLLQELWERRMIRFDAAAGTWTWDIGAIAAVNVASNMAELLTRKQRELPEPTRDLLELAACAGNSCEAELLRVCLDITAQDVAARMAPAVHGDVVFALDPDPATGMPTRYRFAHDRIRQACYDALNDDRRATLHAALGHTLRQRYGDTLAGSQAFEVASHLNMGREELLSSAQRLDLAAVNLQAGREAKRVGSYQSACEYLRRARTLVADGDAMARDISIELADATFLAGDYSGSDSLLAELFRNTRSLEQRCDLQRRRALNAWAMARHDESIRMLLQICADLGLRLPTAPTTLQMLPATLRIYRAAQKLDIGKLGSARGSDARTEILCATLRKLGNYLFYRGDQQLYALCYIHLALMQMARNDADGVGEWALVATIVVATIGNLPLAAKLAQHLQRDAVELGPGHTAIISPMFVSAEECSNVALRAAHDSLAAGEFHYALVHILSGFGAYCARTVELPCALLELGRSIVTTRDDEVGLSTVDYDGKMLLCLRGEISLTEMAEATDEQLRGIPMQVAGGICTVLLPLTVFRDFSTAERFLAAMPPEQMIVQLGSISCPAARYALLGAICILEQAHSSKGRGNPRRRIRPLLAHLRMLAKLSPKMYGVLPMLIDAKLMDLDGRTADACLMYETALDRVAGLDFYDTVAMAYESAGRFYVRHGMRRSAGNALAEACSVYRKWGIHTKVRALLQEFPFLETQQQEEDTERRLPRTASSRINEASIDLQTMLRASQAVSSEVNLDNLKRRILDAILPAAGADYAALLIQQDGHLALVAQQRSSEEVDLPSQSPTDGPQGSLPKRLIDYVVTTRESLSMSRGDANVLWQDDYFRVSQPRSVLCEPILHQNTVVGVVYLENHVVDEAFSRPDVHQIVTILAAQAAIALSNASLYATLEDKVEERTRNLRTVQNKLIALERDTTESRMAGGFAHEMRNALSAARYLVSEALGLESSDTAIDNTQAIEALWDLFDAEGTSATMRDAARKHLRSIVDNEERQRTLWQAVDASTSRAMNVVNMIMEYARLREERAAEEPLDLSVLTRRVVQEAAPLLRGLEVETTISKNCMTRGSEAHFFAMLTNLLTNARDAVQQVEAGRPRRVTVSLAPEGDRIDLAVADSGIGMDREVIDKLGQPFFSTKGGSGTGLGFGTVKKLVELYQGTIDIDSAVGEGSKITIRVPALRG